MSAHSPLRTRQEAAEYLRVSLKTVDRLKLRRCKIMGRVFILQSDLDAYIERSTVEPAPQPAKAAPRAKKKAKPTSVKGTGSDFDAWLRQQRSELVEKSDRAVQV